MDLNFSDPSRDVAQSRRFDLDTNTVIARRTDPHGFIYLNYERGSIPSKYAGAYTSWSLVEEAVRALTAERDAVKAEQQEDARPKIKYKPVKEQAVLA
jgi:hypothetical protein